MRIAACNGAVLDGRDAVPLVGTPPVPERCRTAVPLTDVPTDGLFEEGLGEPGLVDCNGRGAITVIAEGQAEQPVTLRDDRVGVPILLRVITVQLVVTGHVVGAD